MRYNHTVMRDMSQNEDRCGKGVKEGPDRNRGRDKKQEAGSGGPEAGSG